MQMARGLQAAWRRHELSSDQRAGVWARTRAREAHLRVVRRMWMPLLVIGLGAGALGGLCVWVIPSAVVRAYAAGLLTATVVGYLLHQITQMAGTNSALMGELAEQWTAQELRKLRRRGWRVVNHLMLRKWDIDHVLVGPGGVIAIETKWSAQPWELDPPDGRILTAVQQVKTNARDLSLWQPIKASGAAPVSGVVVLWGQSAEASDTRAPKRFDDVVVVTGGTIDDWRHSLPSVGLTDSQVEACWRALESQVRVRDLREGPPPDTVWTIGVRYFAAFAAALIAFVATADALALIDSFAWWPVVYVITAAGGVAALKVQPLRPYAIGWLTGVAATAVIAAVILVTRLS